ncbi:MAG: CDP-alcohol phosphatidyltransferase family protein [Deltaproteobacteria bacterium]|nr:CDP-alcohol phosphatidyltransferase family protein [Deltaproteobacteria bacterium]
MVNALTLSRGILGVLVAWLLVDGRSDAAPFCLFIVAILTDLVDGWLARRLGATTALGASLDPLADKVLTDVCWLALWWVRRAPGYIALVIVVRDVLVAVAYSLATLWGRRFEPNLPGRLMVSFEGVALAVLLFHGPWLGVHWPSVGVALGVITLLLSLVSVAEYASRGSVALKSTHS